MLRTVINIDESKCDGCGICIDSCMEGALLIIDGKARLISELFCDGLGACLKDCPQNAITLEQREAQPYDEKAVIERISKLGINSVKAHLKHLLEHNENEYVSSALRYLNENNIEIDIDALKMEVKNNNCKSGSCPGSQAVTFDAADDNITVNTPSALRQWPVQLHLLNPLAPYFNNADVLIAADCVAFSIGNFHGKFLNGKSLAIACPKLDSEQEIYLEKLMNMIDNGNIRSITVMIMEVPCCGGLFRLVQMALSRTKRKLPLKLIVAGIHGEIKMEQSYVYN